MTLSHFDAFLGAKCRSIAAMPLANELCSGLLEELDQGGVVLGGGMSIAFEGHQEIYVTWANRDEFPLQIGTSSADWCDGSLAVLPLMHRAGGWSEYLGATLVASRSFIENGETYASTLEFEAEGQRKISLQFGTGWAVEKSTFYDDLLLQSHIGNRFQFKKMTPASNSKVIS